MKKTNKQEAKVSKYELVGEKKSEEGKTSKFGDLVIPITEPTVDCRVVQIST
jgi:hypothetical protein